MPLYRVGRFLPAASRILVVILFSSVVVNGMMLPTTKSLSRVLSMRTLPRIQGSHNRVRGNACMPSTTSYSSSSVGHVRQPVYTAFGTARLHSATPQSDGISTQAFEIDDEELLVEDLEDLDLTEGETIDLPKGTMDGFYIVKTYKSPTEEFDMDKIRALVEEEEIERLELTGQNISVPVALMMLDGQEYPSRSRARKACRQANIMIHRGPLAIDEESGTEVFDASKCVRARVGDRIFPGDVLGKQIRVGSGYFPIMNHKKPPFDMPVIFEDDHFAICNKPAGVVVYAQRGGGHGLMTVRAALPFAVAAPIAGTLSILRRPQPVHRLDKPTSGLLLVAKTKPAMTHLSSQFRDRKVKKTYVAIVNGIPPEPLSAKISSKVAYSMGVDVDPDDGTDWQLIDHTLDEKHAITIWRSLKYAKSLKAEDNYVTLVELKPKTGRYHQLRRHMAWVSERPIIGDTEYDGGGSAMQLRGNGLFLCSNRVTLEHPYYNTVVGRKFFDDNREILLEANNSLWLAEDGTVMVSASISIPNKFEAFMDREEERYNLLAGNSALQ